MADTAAFFAKKKKKKKAFKFNANKVDVESVKSSVHVDAPALSTIEGDLLSGSGGDAPASSGNGGVAGGVDSGKGNEQWDDEAHKNARTKKVTATSGTSSSAGTTELLDMKALDPKRNNQNNIKEKLRVQENKALLAMLVKAWNAKRNESRTKKKESSRKQNQWLPHALLGST